MSVRRPDIHISQAGQKYYSLSNIRPVAETAKIKRFQGLVARDIEHGE
jgi:hypothetical protein